VWLDAGDRVQGTRYWAAGRNRATLILRCGGKAGASKDEGCVLGAGVRGGCFEGATRHLSMRAVGVATRPARNEGRMAKRSWMNTCRRMQGTTQQPERSAYAAHPPLACRPSPPQGGRSAGGAARPSLPLRIKRGACPQPISPPVGEMAGRPEGGALAPTPTILPTTPHPPDITIVHPPQILLAEANRKSMTPENRYARSSA
jgi:hypothetical protein